MLKERPSSLEMANTLATLSAKLPRTLRGKDSAPKLTITESSALSVLIFAGAINLGKLAAYEQVTPASISRTIAVLKKRGLVSKIKDKTDGRGAVVKATELGVQMFREGHNRKLAPLVDWIDQLPDSDRTRLLGVIDILDAAGVLGSPKPKN